MTCLGCGKSVLRLRHHNVTAESPLLAVLLPQNPNYEKRTNRTVKLCGIALCLIQLCTTQVLAGTQFASHVSVSTPARSFTHGVGDPIPTLSRRSHSQRNTFRSLRRPVYRPLQSQSEGYPRVRPTIPFNDEEVAHGPHGNSLGVSPWQYNNYMDVSIPVLPPSPYKVDSPDPESLWPEGLFLPPVSPPRFGQSISRADMDSEDDPLDPYLLEGSEAIAAVTKANRHGELYFHEIPHLESLLVNQELRIKNRLKPHRLGSIRHTWPYNRP